MPSVKLYPSVITPVLAWTNPDNAKADDGVYALTAGTRNSNHELHASSFAHSIPSGSVINSVVAEVQYKLSTTASASTLTLQAQKSGVLSGTATNSTTEPTTDTLLSTTDTGTWAYDDLANLEVMFRVRRTSNTGCNYSVDYIAVTINYTEPSYNFTGSFLSENPQTDSLTAKKATSGGFSAVQVALLEVTGVAYCVVAFEGIFTISHPILTTIQGMKTPRAPPVELAGTDEVLVSAQKHENTTLNLSLGDNSTLAGRKDTLVSLNVLNSSNNTMIPIKRGTASFVSLNSHVAEFSGAKEISISPVMMNSMEATLSGETFVSDGIVTENLLVDWRGEDFTNVPPTTSLPDRSGNGKQGNVFNFVYDGVTDGSNGDGAIIFTADAINKHIRTGVRLGNIPVIEAVFKLDRTPINWASIVTAFGGTTEHSGIAFFVHSDMRLGLHYWDGATRHFDLFADVTFTLNRKYHALMQFNTTTKYLEFYLDGVLRKSLYIADLLLGNDMFATGNWAWWDTDSYDWTGLLYQARAYSAVLTPEQIMSNAQISLDLKIVNATLSLSHGLNQNVVGRRNNKSVLTNTLGINQTLVPRRQNSTSLAIYQGNAVTISAKKTTNSALPYSLGINSAMSVRKSLATLAMTQAGLHQTLSARKGSKSLNVNTLGIQQLLTIKKSASSEITTSLGVDVDVANGVKLSLPLGIRQTLTAKKSVSTLTPNTLGLRQNLNALKHATSLGDESLAPQIQVSILKSGSATVAITALSTLALNHTVQKFTALAENRVFAENYEGNKSARIPITLSHGEVLSLSSHKNQNTELSTSLHLENEGTVTKATYTIVNPTLALTVIVYGSRPLGGVNIELSEGISLALEEEKGIDAVVDNSLGIEQTLTDFAPSKVYRVKSVTQKIAILNFQKTYVIKPVPYVKTYTMKKEVY